VCVCVCVCIVERTSAKKIIGGERDRETESIDVGRVCLYAEEASAGIVYRRFVVCVCVCSTLLLN